VTFSIHLNDELVDQLSRAAKEAGKARNALVGEAVKEWLGRRRRRTWPAVVMSFRGVRRSIRFEERVENWRG
jgi:metal-responsive CopG/Arc/MetJ family transcriptional regulator